MTIGHTFVIGSSSLYKDSILKQAKDKLDMSFVFPKWTSHSICYDRGQNPSSGLSLIDISWIDTGYLPRKDL